MSITAKSYPWNLVSEDDDLAELESLSDFFHQVHRIPYTGIYFKRHDRALKDQLYLCVALPQRATCARLDTGHVIKGKA